MSCIGVIDDGSEVLHEVVSLVGLTQLALRLHLVGEHAEVELLVEDALATQLVLPLELLVEGGVADGLTPLLTAKGSVAEEAEDTGLEIQVLTIKLPEWGIDYSFTC